MLKGFFMDRTGIKNSVAFIAMAYLSFMLWILLVCALAGCRSEIMTSTDPETGEVTTEKVYRLDPNEVQKVEAVAEGAVAAGGVASLFWPALAPIAGVAAGVLGTWKKMKPQIMAETRKSEIFYKGGMVLAGALEEVKTTQPEIWAKVGPVIAKATGPVSEAENAIRGFRGMDPL
jgi:hypothetical protein